MVLVWLLFSRDLVSKWLRHLPAGVLLLAFVVYFGLSSTFSELGRGVLLRQKAAGDTAQERLFGQFEEGLFAIYVAPFGEGLGTEQVGGNYYTRGEMTFTTYEGQLPRLVLEMGAFGLAGFLLICAGAVMALQCAKKYAAGRGNQA